MSDEKLFEFTCAACSWRTISDYNAIERRLRSEGMLRREKAPGPGMLHELLTGVAPQLKCPECGTPGLRITPCEDDDWQQAAVCEVCRKAIPPERLEAIPGARRCAGCQHLEETGQVAQEQEYCPRCGALMVLKASTSGGVARYKLFCTAGCRL